MQRTIVGFDQDEDGIFRAQLSCGHAQHVRHNPPFQVREWVMHEEGRAQMLGTELDCLYCNMAQLPPEVAPYKETARFTHESIPAGLLAEHRTKPGVWAEIVVEEGKLEYQCARGVFVLRPGVTGIVEPTSPHQVRPLGPTRFFVRFLRAGDSHTD